MSFGFGVGDFLAVSQLAVRVYNAYKGAPDDFRNISDEINSLHNVVNKVQGQFEGSKPDLEDQERLKEVLQGCQNVLKDLDELLVRYGTMNSDPGLGVGRAVDRVKWGQENITGLRMRLTSNTTLLNTFISRYVQDFLSMVK